MDSPLDWITESELAALTAAHLTTARRWKRHSRLGILPAWLRLLVDTIHRGFLGDISREWAGWRIHRGELYSPEGWAFRPGDVRSLPFLRQQLAHERTRQRLPAQGDWISGQIEPLPGSLVQDAAPRPSAAVVDLAGAARSSQHATHQQHQRHHAGQNQQRP